MKFPNVLDLDDYLDTASARRQAAAMCRLFSMPAAGPGELVHVRGDLELASTIVLDSAAALRLTFTTTLPRRHHDSAPPRR